MQLTRNYEHSSTSMAPDANRTWSWPEADANVLPGANDSVFRVYDLEIDTRKRTVRRSGRFIALTPHEYGLLELLASRRGEIVTRRQIKDHLYKHNQHRSNVIDAHVCYLRHKIDKGFALPLILTRWGEGYLLRGDEEGEPTPEMSAAGASW